MDYRAQLDGLRFIFFFLVFIHHAFGRYYWAGAAGVYGFFVLSGFLITQRLLYDANGTFWERLGRFYWRRSLRIFPLYYLTLTWMCWFGLVQYPWLSAAYLLNVQIFLDQNWPGMTGHFWSLCVEEQFYLLYPLLLLTVPSRFRVGMFVSLILLSKICRCVLASYTSGPLYVLLLPTSGEYLIWGSLAGHFQMRGPLKAPRPGMLILVGFFLVTVWYSLRGIPGSPGSLVACFFDGALDGIGLTLIIVGIWQSKEGLSKILSSPIPAYLGKISYGLYVYHFLVIQSRIGKISPFSDFFVTVIAGMISWHLFENVVLKLRHHLPRWARTVATSTPAT